MSVRAISLAAALSLSTLAAACGSSSTTGSIIPTTATTTAAAGTTPAEALSSIASCLRSQGLTIPEGATRKEIRALFIALPVSQQETYFNACSSTLPAATRRTIRVFIAGEKATTTTS